MRLETRDSALVLLEARERARKPCLRSQREHEEHGHLSADQRKDIIDSLPGIVQNATASEVQPEPSEEAPGQPEPAPEQREQVRAGRQWLKNQYLQRAHSHVIKKEYDKALSEIRRVFIIDDRDRFAREFELKVLQMQELSRRKTLVFDEGGLEKGDVITEVDGERVTDGIALIVAIRAHQPGETVEFTIERGDEEKTVELTLGSEVG